LGTVVLGHLKGDRKMLS